MKIICISYRKSLIISSLLLISICAGRSIAQTVTLPGSDYTIEESKQSSSDSVKSDFEYKVFVPPEQSKPKRILVEFQGMTLAQFYKENQKTDVQDFDLKKQQFIVAQNSIFENFERDIAILFIDYSTKRLQSDPGAKVHEPVLGKKFHKLFFGQQVTIDSLMIQYIEKLPYVKKVHHERRLKASLDESVPQIHADSVWINLNCEGDSIRVGIIDTGIDYTHPDLGDGFGEGHKVVGGYDFVNLDDDPMDDNEHGTHVAGIVAADGVVKGVAPKAWLYAIKVLNENGGGWTSDVVSGIEYTVDPNNDDSFDDKLDVANMSLGGEKYEESDPVETAVENATALGVTYCIAAGNTGFKGPMSIESPGTTPSGITVGGTRKEDQTVDWFSSLGPTPITYILKPDVVAPGFYINSTVPGGGYAMYGGTSMATPHVAGTAALLKKLHPEWTPEDIKSAIMTTAHDLGEIKIKQGAGFLDAYEASMVKTLFSSATLNFGVNDLDDGDIWTAEQTFSIKNIYDQDQSYEFAMGDTPEGVSFMFSEPNPTLTPDESRNITVTIHVDNSVLPNFPSTEYPTLLMFAGTILATTATDTLQCLWSFNRGSIVKLSSDRGVEMFFAWTPEGYFKSEFFSLIFQDKIIVPKDFTCLACLADTVWWDYDTSAYPLNYANRHILKNIHMQPGDTVLTISSDEANNKIIFSTVDEAGQHITPVSTTYSGFGMAITDSLYINFIRYVDNDEVRMAMSGLGMATYGTGHRVIDIENRFWTNDPDDQMTMLDTIYLSDMPDSILIAGGETRWNLAAEPNTMCFNSFDAVEGLDHNIVLQNDAGDYKNITYVSGGFDNLDWTPMMYWQFNSYLNNSIGYDGKHTASVVDIYMPSLEDKPEKIFYYFRLQEGFNKLAGPLRCIDDHFYWSSAATPDLLKYNPGDTLRDATGYRFLVSELYMNKTANRIHARFTEKDPNNHILSRGNYCEIYDSEGDFVDKLYSFYYLDSLPPGAYSTSYNSSTYNIYHKTGGVHVRHDFDLTREDATPPMLTLFRITDSDTSYASVFDKGDTALVQFSLADNNYYAIFKHTYQPVNNDSTKVYIKPEASDSWLEIPIDSVTEDPRSGIYYSGIITETEYDSSYFDLMLRSVDTAGNSVEHTFSPAFVVRNIQIPTANDDFLVGRINHYLSASEIILNDVNPFGSPFDFQVIITSQPQHGSLQLNEPRYLLYTPDTDFMGEDEFTYKVRNEKYTSNIATVDILINETGSGLETYEGEETGLMLTCYPNPAHGMLNVRIKIDNDQPAMLLLYDIHGKWKSVLYDGMLHTGTNDLELKLTDLNPGVFSPGIYILELITENRVITEKVVIK